MNTSTNPPVIYVNSVSSFASQAVQVIQEALGLLTFTDSDTGFANYYFSTIYGIAEKDLNEETKDRPITTICGEYQSVQPNDKDFSSCFFYVHGQNLTYQGQYMTYDISLLGWLNESRFGNYRTSIAYELTDAIYRQVFNKNQWSANPLRPIVDEDGIQISTQTDSDVWKDFSPETFLNDYQKYISYRIRFKVSLQVGCLPINNINSGNACLTC